ncbi:MAG: hypothetical protein HY898_26020 [Deltaproteobacteria bacterium]|nr:hypothetical protein [Deltaproteobacteria bacterium]
MANIQLGQEILAVEAYIDERNHDLAFRQLVLLRDKYGRRPEFRYLQAFFDATFEVRTDRELLRDVTALVAEQPDFTEAVALLAFLYDRVGDRAKAEVFAREALRSHNPKTLARARRVLGIEANAPIPGEGSTAATPAKGTPSFPDLLPSDPSGHQPFEPPSLSGPETVPAGADYRMPPVFAPSAKPSSPPPGPNQRAQTRELIPVDPTIQHSDEPGRFPGSEAVTAQARQLTPNPAPFDPFGNLPPPGTSSQGSQPALPALETISFQPVGGLPPPPSIPPAAMAPLERSDSNREMQAPPRESPTLPGFAQVRVDSPKRSTPPPAASRQSTPPAGYSALGLQEPKFRSTRPPSFDDDRETIERMPPEQATDQTGPEGRSQTRPSRPAMAIPPPLEVQRHWFKYARQHQVTIRSTGGSGDSTALTLVDLAERVMEGRTPIANEPIPLDRRGLILVEQKLEQFRTNKGTVSAAERAATTSAAAFLLAVLMKEAEARAVDTTPEDGACKAVLPSGASVRPLLIAASFARARGPGLVESYDRAATAHMQRTPRPPTANPRFPSAEYETQPAQKVVPAGSLRGATRRAPLSVPRRDLDASTLCVVDPGAPTGLPPQVNLRAMAEDYWNSPDGREVAGTSRRVGTFTLADIDAIERHATKLHSLVGLWPPGNPWPWVPTEDQQRQIVIWGAILGEVLNGVYTGRWEVDPSDPQDKQLHRVVLAGTVVAWPMAKVYLRLARGVSHDLSVYVDVIGRIVGRQATRALNV